MIRKTLVAAACGLLVAVGFAAGYAVGISSARKATPIEPTPMDRWAQWMLDETERTKPQVDKQMEDAERLQRAYMNKLDRDLRKIQDKE